MASQLLALTINKGNIMNIRLAKAISTYSKLEHSLTSADCLKVMNELEDLIHFLEMGEMAIEEEREYQKRLELQDRTQNQLRIVRPKDRSIQDETPEEDL